MTDIHVPEVVITTPDPAGRFGTDAVLCTCTVDGRVWPVNKFEIDGNVDGLVNVTLRFVANVKIGPAEPQTYRVFSNGPLPEWLREHGR